MGTTSSKDNENIIILYGKINEYIEILCANVKKYIMDYAETHLKPNNKFNQGIIDRLVNSPDIYVPIFVKFISCAFINIRRKPNVIPERWYIAQDITENAGENNINNYRIHKSLHDIILHTICTNKNLINNFVTIHEQEFINLVCSDILRLGKHAQYIKNTDRFIGSKRFTALLIHMGDVGKVFSFNSADSELNSINQAKTIEYLKTGNIDSLTMLGSCLDIIRKEMNAKLTEVAANDRRTMESLLAYAHEIDKSICEMLNTRHNIIQHNGIILKGGNVFKIYLENTLSRLETGQLVLPKQYKFLADLLKAEKGLSDWDFSLETHGILTTYNGIQEDMMETTKKIFTAPNVSLYLKANRVELSSRIRDYHYIYNDIRKHIVKKLNDYRDAHNDYWKAFSQIICKSVMDTLHGDGVTQIKCRPVSSVSDVSSNLQKKMFVPEGTYDDEKHSTVRADEYGLSDINRALYCERDFDKFMELFNNSVEHISQKHVDDSCIKIVDMEVYSIETDSNKSKSIDGFDLIRLSSKYEVELKCSQGIILRFNCITEIFDFSHNKPCTIGYYLHGDEHAGDFESVTMLYTNITMKSYSLFWFAKDIFRMSMQAGYSPKFTKRAKRLYDSLIMIAIKALSDNAYKLATIQFTRMPHTFFKSNLLNLIQNTIINVLKEKNPAGILPYFETVDNIFKDNFYNPIVLRIGRNEEKEPPIDGGFIDDY